MLFMPMKLEVADSCGKFLAFVAVNHYELSKSPNIFRAKFSLVNFSKSSLSSFVTGC
jgi:hypothetical protein